MSNRAVHSGLEALRLAEADTKDLPLILGSLTLKYAVHQKGMPRPLQGPGAPPEAKPPAPKPEDVKAADAESKFKAFTGRPRSLRD